MKRQLFVLAGAGISLTIIYSLVYFFLPLPAIDWQVVPWLVGGLLTANVVVFRWASLRLLAHRERARLDIIAEHQHFGHQQELFIDRLNHQMKNELQAIELALTNLNPSNTQEVESLKIAQENTHQLRALVNSLGELFKLDRGDLTGDEVKLGALLVRETERLRQQTGADIKVQIPVARPLSPILGNAELLRQAFRNILDNAIKYSNPGHVVHLDAKEFDQFVRVEVSDSGRGIPPNELPYIGELLFRSETIKDTIPGSGLGLALSKRIIELHGGKLEVDSTLDVGTTVTVRLPSAKL